MDEFKSLEREAEEEILIWNSVRVTFDKTNTPLIEGSDATVTIEDEQCTIEFTDIEGDQLRVQFIMPEIISLTPRTLSVEAETFEGDFILSAFLEFEGPLLGVRKS